ncbi:MAG: FAD-binding oxidoreductase [Pseudomonadota bacterium]
MKQDVLIIGGGITGVSIALKAQRKGMTCCIVDALPAASPDRTSFGNAGILARNAVLPTVTRSAVASLGHYMTSSKSPVSFRYRYGLKWMPWTLRSLMHISDAEMQRISKAQDYLLFDTVEQHLALAAGTKAATMIAECDMAYLYKSEKDARTDNQEAWVKKERGIFSKELRAAELQQNDPHLSPEYTFALSYPDHGWISDPGAYLSALYDSFELAGGTIHLGDVAQVTSKDAILKSGKTLSASQIVIAAGAKSVDLLRPFGVNIPMIAERGYHIHIPNSPIKPPSPYLVEGKFGLTPMQTGLRVAGTTELSSIDAPVQNARFDFLKRSIKDVYPQVDLSDITTWVGHRPSLPDSMPCIGRLSKHPNIICAFGGQHLGLTMGPKVGQIVSEILLDQPSNADLTPYTPDRFEPV